MVYHIVGVFNAEGPPVPIPNTEVKLCSAENTCLATDWEDRSTPTYRNPGTSVPGFFLFLILRMWAYFYGDSVFCGGFGFTETERNGAPQGVSPRSTALTEKSARKRSAPWENL